MSKKTRIQKAQASARQKDIIYAVIILAVTNVVVYLAMFVISSLLLPYYTSPGIEFYAHFDWVYLVVVIVANTLAVVIVAVIFRRRK